MIIHDNNSYNCNKTKSCKSSFPQLLYTGNTKHCSTHHYGSSRPMAIIFNVFGKRPMFATKKIKCYKTGECEKYTYLTSIPLNI